MIVIQVVGKVFVVHQLVTPDFVKENRQLCIKFLELVNANQLFQLHDVKIVFKNVFCKRQKFGMIVVCVEYLLLFPVLMARFV
jgi:hypothetical protein